jgi:L-threonylcarbamoyladenylate synthase
MKVSQKELILAVISGTVVSFPTDTVPALASLPQKAGGIFTLKKRSQDKPLILMGASFNTFKPYLQGTTEEINIWQEMTKKFWPGALTLVLPASNLLPKVMNPTNSQTIGVRVPNLKIALDILTETGPLATTSANLSGQPPLETMEAINQAFPQVFTLDGDYVGSGQPSTVAKWTNQGWEILRQGSVKL